VFSCAGGFGGGAVRHLGIEGLDAHRVSENLELLYLACGKTDFVFEAANKLDKQLTEKGIDHVYTVSEGGHTWSNWRDYLKELAPMLFQKK